jgi:hypothetical protein
MRTDVDQSRGRSGMARLTAGTRAKGFGVTAGWWRLAIAGAVAVVGGVVPAGLAAASGSNTIATAPVLTYGQLEVAGGKQDEFWRINTFAGDALTIRADLGESTILHFEVYDPSVDDFRIQEAAAVARWDGNGYMSGKREIKLDIPFSGQGTLAFCERNAGGCSDTGRGRPAPTVPFTATVEHRTVTTLGGVPRLVRSPASPSVIASSSAYAARSTLRWRRCRLRVAAAQPVRAPAGPASRASA